MNIRFKPFYVEIDETQLRKCGKLAYLINADKIFCAESRNLKIESGDFAFPNLHTDYDALR